MDLGIRKKPRVLASQFHFAKFYVSTLNYINDNVKFQDPPLEVHSTEKLDMKQNLNKT